MTENVFDYIIVGAGSAGCVLANRLSANGKHNVLLMEAGGSDASLFIKMPTALSYPMNNPKYNWFFKTEAEPALQSRKLDCPRGKVLGGSSSINGMVYVRGHACDFDEWQQLGAQGWSYKDCLPYFKRLEAWHGGADSYRGSDGPMVVGTGNNMQLNPLYQAFVDAGNQAGYPITDDYNAQQQEGFGAMQMTVSKGIRCSASRAYLNNAKKRKNLSVLTRVQATKVILENKTAVGIEYQQAQQTHRVRARKEVIVSCGAIGSPTLLQLSGIGPSEVLQQAGVKIEHDLPGVGENLQDHLEVYFQFKCKKPITLNNKLGLISKGLIGARWMLFRDGLGSTNHFESCGFIRSSAGKKWPDIQYHFLPAAMRYDGQKAFDGHGFQVHVGPNKPLSRGRVKITNSDPLAKPSIVFNYLQHPQDKKDWRQCIRLTREIIHQGALDEYRGEEIQPGAHIQSDADIDQWVQDNVESAYHPAGTCKMGSDALSVVDAQCRVQGIKQLRVVDASIMPTVTNANLNAPTLMLAEKAADMILGNAPLAPLTADTWVDPNWQQQQRLKPAQRKVTP